MLSLAYGLLVSFGPYPVIIVLGLTQVFQLRKARIGEDVLRLKAMHRLPRIDMLRSGFDAPHHAVLCMLSVQGAQS